MAKKGESPREAAVERGGPGRRVAVYPGSFDPPTLGHLDVLQRAAPLFDCIVVGVLENPAKKALLPPEERVRLLRAEAGALGLEGVEVRAFSGLTIDFAEAAGASWILRGVRSAIDLEDEMAMAHTNRAASRRAVETVLIPARGELAFIRGRLAREIAAGGGALAALVPPAVEKALRERLGSGSGRR